MAVLVGLASVAAPLTAHAATTVTQLPSLPLTSVTAPGSVTGTGPNGEPTIYWMSSGNPAIFAGTHARTGEVLVSMPVPTAQGSWTLTRHKSGDIYIGSYGEGRLFRYVPGATALEDLGEMAPGETFIWSTTQDENGVIYAGTGQFGGHVVSYDPATGAKRDYGTWGDNDRPIIQRGIAAGLGRIWVGSGPTPQLTEIDIATGARTNIPLPDIQGQNYVMDLDLRGELLFMRASTSGSPMPLHVYDVKAGKWIESIDNAAGLRVSETSPDGRYIYFVRNNTLHRYDLEQRTWEATSFSGMGDMRAFGWLDLQDPAWPGMTLVGAKHTGAVWRWNPTTGKGDSYMSDVPGAPANLRSATEGPDGRIYFGSYLGGGLASYDPRTNATEFIYRIPQAESMTSHDGAVYAGGYPRAEVWQYRPDQPTVAGQNPKVVLNLYDQGQSRIWAMASAGRYLAVGTVPHNGATGGLLALVDPRTGENWTVKVAGGQSVVGLVHRDGILYGTTSAFGGSGAPRPTDMNSHVFAYDIEKRTMLWMINPKQGEGALGELAFDKAGNLWTAGPTSVHKLDPATGALLATRTYEPFPWNTVEYVWVGSHLWTDPQTDKLMVTAQGAAYEVDPLTLERTRVFRPVSVAFTTNSGVNYALRDIRAWQWTTHAPVAASLTVEPTVRLGASTTIKVEGLGANEPVTLRLRPSGDLLANVVADAQGRVSYTHTVPLAASLGAGAVEVERPLTRGILRKTWTTAEQACTRTITGSAKGVVVRSGEVVCVRDADVRGGITVLAGGQLFLENSSVRGEVNASGADAVVITGSSVRGSIILTGVRDSLVKDSTATGRIIR